VISTTDVYRKVVLPKVGWPVIPVLVLPDQPGVQGGPRYIQDTSDIIDELERLHPTPSVLPAAAEQRLACYLAELLADQWLNLPAMYYRWLFPEQRPFLENEWGAMMAPEALPAERLAAARQSMKQFANAATSLGATAETAAAIESSFEALLDLLSAHFLGSRVPPWRRSNARGFRHDGPAVCAPAARSGERTANILTIACLIYAACCWPQFLCWLLTVTELNCQVPGKLVRMRAPLVATWIERVMGAFFGCIFSRNAIVCQDRLGTNVRELKTDGVSAGMPRAGLFAPGPEDRILYPLTQQQQQREEEEERSDSQAAGGGGVPATFVAVLTHMLVRGVGFPCCLSIDSDHFARITIRLVSVLFSECCTLTVVVALPIPTRRRSTCRCCSRSLRCFYRRTIPATSRSYRAPWVRWISILGVQKAPAAPAQVRTQPAFSLFGHEKRPLNLPRQARDNHKKETRWKETHTEREGAVFSFRAEILR
jgi:glutathione S-transferase